MSGMVVLGQLKKVYVQEHCHLCACDFSIGFGKVIHLFVSSSIVLTSGWKFDFTRSDLLGGKVNTGISCDV